MKKHILILSIFFIGIIKVNAQLLWAGNDTAICSGQSATLTTTLANPVGGPIVTPTNALLCGATNNNTCDDGYSDPINIGFTFNFYGNNYTQCLIGTNSVVTFNLAAANGFCPWSIGNNCPSAANPTNAIMFPWQDNLPTRPPAKIWYKTIGVAPNRIFVVEFLDVQAFSCGALNCYGNQIMLYETSNIIETHIIHKAACANWNSGRGLHGIQNATGTIAHVVPGRNGLDAPWYVNEPGFAAAPNSAGPEGRRWTPTSATNYNITVIPFKAIYMPPTLPVATTIQWSIVGGGNIGTGNSILVTPTSTSNYIVTIGLSGNCASLSYSDTVKVSFSPLPLTVSPNSTICLGDTATIFVNSVLAIPITYVWSPSPSLNSTTNDTVQAFPINTTVYTVSASGGGCINTASVTVNVNSLPIPAVSPVNPQICDGSSVTMIASGGTSYLWTPIAGLSTTTAATVTATPTNTTPYTIIVTDANGCKDSMVNTVSFYSNPTVTASSALLGVCPTFSTQFQASGAVSYVWAPSSGLNFTNIANPVSTPTATTTYTVTATDINGCTNTDDVTILLYDNPTALFSAPITSGCSPVTINLVNSSSILSGTVDNYIWSIEGAGISNQPNPSYTILTPGNYDVQLTAISNNGCTNTMSIVDYINVYSVPIANFTATPQPANMGDAEITFTNTSTLDAVNFLWDFAGFGTSPANSPSFEFGFADTFNVILYVSTANGCLDTVMQPIIIEELSEIWVPNSFTPGNLDGINDTWFPVGRNLNNGTITINVEIFDKWGMRIFFSDSSDKPWYGSINNTNNLCAQGIYVYKIAFINEKGKEFYYSGHISLIQ